MNVGNIVLFVLVFLSVLRVDAPAYAYLDPGTGSMLVQLLLGGVAGVLVVGKLYWHRIKVFFGLQPSQHVSRDVSRDVSREPASDADVE